MLAIIAKQNKTAFVENVSAIIPGENIIISIIASIIVAIATFLNSYISLLQIYYYQD